MEKFKLSEGDTYESCFREIEAEINRLRGELDELKSGTRPEPPFVGEAFLSREGRRQLGLCSCLHDVAYTGLPHDQTCPVRRG